VLSTGLTYD